MAGEKGLFTKAWLRPGVLSLYGGNQHDAVEGCGERKRGEKMIVNNLKKLAEEGKLG